MLNIGNNFPELFSGTFFQNYSGDPAEKAISQHAFNHNLRKMIKSGRVTRELWDRFLGNWFDDEVFNPLWLEDLFMDQLKNHLSPGIDIELIPLIRLNPYYIIGNHLLIDTPQSEEEAEGEKAEVWGGIKVEINEDAEVEESEVSLRAWDESQFDLNEIESFKKLTRREMIFILEDEDISYPLKGTKAELVEVYKDSKKKENE